MKLLLWKSHIIPSMRNSRIKRACRYFKEPKSSVNCNLNFNTLNAHLKATSAFWWRQRRRLKSNVSGPYRCVCIFASVRFGDKTLSSCTGDGSLLLCVNVIQCSFSRYIYLTAQLQKSSVENGELTQNFSAQNETVRVNILREEVVNLWRWPKIRHTPFSHQKHSSPCM